MVIMAIPTSRSATEAQKKDAENELSFRHSREDSREDSWGFNQTCFDDDLDCDDDINSALSNFGRRELSKKTCLRVISASGSGSQLADCQSAYIEEEQALSLLESQNHTTNRFELYGISNLLQDEHAQEQLMGDEWMRLRVSQRVLRSLVSKHQVPVTFLSVIARTFQVCGTGYRRLLPDAWDYWCLLPVRVCIHCELDPKDHNTSMAGSNQMDPFNYIHLDGVKTDIRGSFIGMFMRGDVRSGRMRFIVVNLLDPRWRRLIEQPLERIHCSLRRRTCEDLDRSPCFPFLIYLAYILRWWNSVLLCFNHQLIQHEKRIQQEIADETPGFTSTSKSLNTALHIMAAHLYRYKTELQRIDLILSDLLSHRGDMTSKTAWECGESSNSNGSLPPIDRERERIEQLVSKLKAISSFSDEMERKVNNILALLFNQIQAINDKTLQAILSASQQDTRLSQKISMQSHLLAISMRKDSAAMKTIAVLTMLFLPGTSFAAVFAMPFFTETEYLTAPSQVWIWVVLTFVFTVVAFGGFQYVITRKETSDDPEDDKDSH